MDKRVRVGGVQLAPLEAALVSHVFDNGFVGPGEFTKTFERELAAAHGYKHCLCLNSGQSALMIALEAYHRMKGQALNKGEKPKVALPAVTYISTFAAAIQAGWDVELIDVTPDIRANILWDQIPDSSDKCLRAIMPVNLFGRSIDTKPEPEPLIQNMADVQVKPGAQSGYVIDITYPRIVVEDACEAIYAPGVGFGDAMCVSFYSSHTITAGMGGAVMTNNEALYFKVWQLVNHGRQRHDDYTSTVNLRDRFTFDEIGYSLKFSDLNAAIGLGQHFNRHNSIEVRSLVAEQLKDRIDELGWIETMPMDGNTWMMFPMRILGHRTRDEVIAALNAADIETRMLMPLTSQPIVKKMLGDDVEDRYPNAKMLNETAFYVGCHPMMDDEDIERICSVLEDLT